MKIKVVKFIVHGYHVSGKGEKMDFLQEINEKYPVRKTEKQKAEFRQYVVETVCEKGAEARVETIGNHNNVVIGDPQTAKTVFTAHYDTPCASLFPNLMMPRNKGLFYLYQFVIIFLFLALSLTPAIIVGMNILQSEIAYVGIFLVIYFGLFFLGFKTFTNKHNANDNTSGVATVLLIICKLSKEQLNNVAFILFDNEEKGLQGAKAYSKAHKEQMQDKLLVNFDCVANGNNVIFIAKQKAEENPYYKALKESFVSNEEFNVSFNAFKDSVSNSDYKKFEQGVCCVACKKSKKGILYTPYIHTGKDVVADSKNVEFLALNIYKFVDKIV